MMLRRSFGNGERKDDGNKLSDEELWSPERIAKGAAAAKEMDGDLVLLKRRDNKYYGRMGVVVRRGTIVDDGQPIFEVHLFD